jgi:hypothetical protein
VSVVPASLVTAAIVVFALGSDAKAVGGSMAKAIAAATPEYAVSGGTR